MRLVPNQDPKKIGDLFEAYVQEDHAEDRGAEGHAHARRQAVDDGLRQPVTCRRPAARSSRASARRPVFNREGGSIPVVATFQEELGLPCVLFGVGLPDENAHAPDEKLDLGNFHNGIIASAFLYKEIGALAIVRPRFGALREFYGVLGPPPPIRFSSSSGKSCRVTPSRAARSRLAGAPAHSGADAGRGVSRAAKELLAAIALAGPHRDERLELVRATVGEFKRHRDELDARPAARRRAAPGVALARASHPCRSRHARARAALHGRLSVAAGRRPDVARDCAARGHGARSATAPKGSRCAGSVEPRAHAAAAPARQSLASSLPRDVGVYREAVTYFRHHAQHTCLAVGPHCGVCPLAPVWRPASCRRSGRSVQRRHPAAQRLDVLPDLLVVLSRSSSRLARAWRASDTPRGRAARRRSRSCDTRAARDRAARSATTARAPAADR